MKKTSITVTVGLLLGADMLGFGSVRCQVKL